MSQVIDKRDNSLVIIRVLAVCFIVTCHILQGYGNSLAYVFNVGVQMFFILSGFLYGKREITNITKFFKTRLLKVYLPYFIFLVLTFLIYSIFLKGYLTFEKIIFYFLNLQAFTAPIEGLNHLWFLSVLLICYALTPVIQKLLEKFQIVFLIAILLLYIFQFFYFQKMYSISLWILTYFLGYLYAKYENRIFRITFMAIILLAFACMLPYFSLNVLVDPIYSRYSVWLHVVSAFVIFLTMYHILSSIRSLKNLKLSIIKWIDKFSYEIYLIHHIVILGPLSLLFLTQYPMLNISIIVCVTLFSALILKKIIGLIQQKIKI